MKITFLGASSGESYPVIRCDCPNFTYARKHGGRNLRMNTTTLLDDDVLLDLNACSFHTAAQLGISLTGMKHLPVTHLREDHLSLKTPTWREERSHASELSDEDKMGAVSPRFTALPMLTVYGNVFVRDALLGKRPDLFNGTCASRMCFQEICESKRTEAENIAFTPIRAVHGQQIGFAHSYIIERGGKTLLYALDFGSFDPDMMQIVLSKKYDAIISEGTFGLSPVPNESHMNRDKNRAFRNQLIEYNCITDTTPFFLTHLVSHWTPPYDQYAPMMAEEGITVSYDGMRVEI